MTATPAELLRELDAKATKGPWFVVGPPWNRGEPFINAWCEDPHGGQPVCDFAIQAENDDGGPRSDPHPAGDAQLVVTLRNVLPLLAAYTEAADALLKAIDDLDAENGDRNLFVSPGCLICTDGTTPDRYNTGLCAYHRAKAAREALVRAMQEGQ